MAQDPNINYSEVKITKANERDLEASNENLANNLNYQRSSSKNNIHLAPIKNELRDSAPNQSAFHPVSRLPEIYQRSREQAGPPQSATNNVQQKVKRLDSSETSSPTRLMNKKIKKGYQIASYIKVMEFQNSQCYRLKDKDGDYEHIGVCGSNEELREFGLGIFLYFQFIKRLTITLLLMSAVVIMPMIQAYGGSGLSAYTSSSSFTMTLASLTIGNISNGNRQTYLIVTISDLLSMLILFFFWIHWRHYHKSIIEDIQKDHKIVSPANYVVSVQNFYDECTNRKTLEADLRAYIDGLYKGAFEVEVVYNYQGNFDKFVEYDEGVEAVEKEHQIIKQTGKNAEKLGKLEGELSAFQQQLLHISQAFEPMYAFIHFRTLKAKIAFLNHCRRYRLQNTLGQAFSRALCCVQPPPERFLFLGKFPLMLRSTKMSRPEEINWRNNDLTDLSRAIRWTLSLLLVVISILITSALIGFCTLYVASTSNCSNYVAPSGATFAIQISNIQKMTSGQASATYCYCNQNLESIYTDPNVGSFCSSITNKVLITNILQVAASAISSVTNVILGIIITLISKYLLRPNSIPKEYGFIFWGVLFSNFINTGIIPLLLNANVLGVEFVNYIKFINFIDYTNLSIFSDFTPSWYALISPYYLNFIIIGCIISPLISLIVFAFKNCFKLWRLKAKCEDNDKDDPLIQKEADMRILGLEFSYAEETSMVMLLLLIGVMYSGLIPLMIPFLALGMIWIYLCKKTIVLKYSIKIPADETLNESVINLIPFIILVHSLFSMWSHTTSGLFQQGAPVFSLNITIFNNSVDRIFGDVVMLAEVAFIVVVIIIDYTLISFFGWLGTCCKDELQMPPQWAAIENQNFSERIQRTNILGSYKLVNNPTYGHALKAYNQLLYRSKKEAEITKDNLNPEFQMA